MSAPRAEGKILVNAQVTKAEREQIKANAAWFGMPVSAFLRHVALGGTIDWSDPNLKRRAQGRRMGVAA